MIRLAVAAANTVAYLANATLNRLMPPQPDDLMAVAEAVGVTPMPDALLVSTWADLADDRIAAFIEGGAR